MGMNIGELAYSLFAQWDKQSLKDIGDGFEEASDEVLESVEEISKESEKTSKKVSKDFDEASKKISLSFDTISKSFVKSVGIASASLSGSFAIAKEFAGVNDELGKLARNKDVAIGTLQAVQYSFESAGIEGDKLKDVFEKLKEQKEAFRQGKGDTDAFAMLGLNPNKFKTTEEYFYAVLDSLKKIKNEDLKSDLSKRLLGFSDMKNLIDGGSEAIREQKKELEEIGALINEQDYKASADFNDTLLKTTTILKGLANKVMTSIMPIFTELMKNINAFIKANKDLISSGLKEFLTAIVNGSKFFLSLITRIVTTLLTFKPTLILIAGLFLAWQLPLIIAITAITALFIALDDLFSFLKGEDSLLGDWLGIKGFEQFKKEFPTIGAIFQSVADTLINIWDLVTGKINFNEFFTKQIEMVKIIFTNFVNWLSSLIDEINIFDKIGNQIDGFTNRISSFMGFGGFQSQVSTNPTMVDSSSTNSNITTNNYNISATVDAKSKSISEAITEISNPSGY